MGLPNGSMAAAAATIANPDGPWWRDGGLRKLVFWQSWMLVSQMTVGYDEVIVGTFQAMDPWQKGETLARTTNSGAMPMCTTQSHEQLINLFSAMGNPTPGILGLITALVFVGGFAGALVVAYPADKFGRRPTIQFGSLLCIIGSALQSAAPNRNVFIGGRFILGFGISFTTCAGPSLLNELSHPRLRGKMASMVRMKHSDITADC